MKNNKYKYRKLAKILFSCLLVTGAVSSAAAEESKNYIEIGLGFMSSPEQKDILDQTYSDYRKSGGGSMINIDLGYSIAVNNYFSIVPKLNLLAYRAEFKNSNFPVAGSTKSNVFVMPGISLRYNLNVNSGSFFVSGYAAKNNASSDFSRVNGINGNGIATGMSVGYTFSSFQFEFGVMKLPVTIETDSVPSKNADFGGTFFTIKRVM